MLSTEVISSEIHSQYPVPHINYFSLGSAPPLPTFILTVTQLALNFTTLSSMVYDAITLLLSLHDHFDHS